MNKQICIVGLAFAVSTYSATFDVTSGIYQGRVVGIGCHFGPPQGADNQCYALTEVPVSRKGSSTSCNHMALRWWGKSAEGALAASLLTDALIAGTQVEMTSGSACFEGWSTYPALTTFKLKANP